MKLLLLDIETAPHLAHAWGLWNQNIAPSQIVKTGYVMCWAAKWYGDSDDKIIFDSLNQSSPRKMLRRIHSLLGKADAVIHYNGQKFDIPTLNKEFIQYGMQPPAPYKQIDLFRVCRKEFRFASNRLDFVAKQLGLGGKIGHEGHELWIKCMDGDPEAWEVMERYNCHDVYLLENVYERLLPWIKSHPNQGVYQEDPLVCPNCAGNHFVRRGYAYTNAGRYPRFRCKDCGRWFRGAYANRSLDEQKFRNITD